MIFVNQLVNENLRLIPKIYEAKFNLLRKLNENSSFVNTQDLILSLGAQSNKLIVERDDFENSFSEHNIDDTDFWELFFFFNSQNDFYMTISKSAFIGDIPAI